MGKVEFKKEYGFSPDRFDAACMTFFKDEPTQLVHLTKEQVESKEAQDFINRQNQARKKQDPLSSMSSM